MADVSTRARVCESDMRPPEEKQEAFVSQVRQGWFELDQSMEVGLRSGKNTQNEKPVWT